MRPGLRGGAFVVLAALACGTLGWAAEPPAAAPAHPMMDKVALVCDGKAKTDGKIEFQVTPQGGQTSTVSVTLMKGMSKQEACRDIAKELGVALGPGFEVKQYDDDKVKVEGKEKAQFSLVLGSVTVQGITVGLK